MPIELLHYIIVMSYCVYREYVGVCKCYMFCRGVLIIGSAKYWRQIFLFWEFGTLEVVLTFLLILACVLSIGGTVLVIIFYEFFVIAEYLS